MNGKDGVDLTSAHDLLPHPQSPFITTQLETMPTNLKGWHQGERALQGKLGFGDAVRMNYTYITSYMPEQHRVFHTSNIPFIPVAILDEDGRPWSSVFAGKAGEVGFVKSSDEYSMSIDLVTWEGDPLLRGLKGRRDEIGRVLMAGVGVELSTRRRNKFAGWVESSSIDGSSVHLNIHVNQAVGCVQRSPSSTIT